MDEELLNVEIARAGSDITFEELQSMVKNLGLNKEGVPVTIGHPQHNSPSYGWLKKLWLDGKKLMADFDVLKEFKEWLKKKLFKNRSISWYPNYQGKGLAVLRHVGFLGGMPPQIKGMNPLVLSAKEDFKTIEYDEHNYKFGLIGDLFQNFRDWMIQEIGLELADRLFATWTIDQIKKEIKEVDGDMDLFVENLKEQEKECNMGKENVVTYTEGQHNSLLDAALLKQKTEMEADTKEQIKTLTEENTTLNKENKDLKVENKKTKAESAVVQLIKDCKLLPKEKDLTIEILINASDALFAKAVKEYSARKPFLQLGENTDLTDYEQDNPQEGKVKEVEVFNYADMEERAEKERIEKEGAK